MRVELAFRLPRPKSHYVSNDPDRELRKDAPDHHFLSNRDVDKLTRCVLDSLTGVVFEDDGQVAELEASKRYARTPGVEVVVVALD